MKKTLLAIAVVAAGFSANAQVDTLSSHCISTTLFTGVIDDVTPIDSGFIGGTNFYGDLAKMQLFDATYGVTGGGVITGIALPVIAKVDNGGSVTFAIWGDNAGAPNYASPLGSVTVNLSAIDTTLAATQDLADANFFNNVATFSTPVTIPANNKFWAGFILPTGNNLFATAISSPFNGAGATHTGEIQGSGTFFSFDNGTNATWQLDAALTIFPIVDFTSGVNENVVSSSVYPNPANDVLNIKVGNEEIATVSIVSMDGKVVATSTNGTVNITDITAGMYMYQVTTVAGKLANGNFTKK